MTPGLKRRFVAAAVMGAGLCFSLQAQDPVKAFPKNYSVVLENKSVAVIRVHYGPHEKVGVHDHSIYPVIYVYLSDSGPVRFAHFEEKAFTTVRPPLHTGAFRVAPGRPERHTVENLGDIPTDFLRVELKQAGLKLQSPFRGKAPASLAKSLDVVEFVDGHVEVERILCVGAEACPVSARVAPSLLIAITPGELLEVSGGGAEKLGTGAVRWLSASKAARLSADGKSPAEFLRIVIPNRLK